MQVTNVFGAFATICIRFDGSLEQLVKLLATALNIASMNIAPSEYPPHIEVASAEVLGWEFWLQEYTKKGVGFYRLRIETEHCVNEIFHGQMHDLSPWLARLISMLCDVETEAIGNN
jgi:hypothetical protein